MRCKYFTLTLLITFIYTATAIAQSENNTDTTLTAKALDEVVITATRSERKLGNIAVPVTIISKKAIQQSGSLRLNNILSEQAGLLITNSFGSGVQMQGLNPDYTLILVDGEPLVGRNTGVLDLSRITVANINKIEIIKGPSSSLYGSEALAGVINIITEASNATTAGASVRYGSFNTTDININAGLVKRKFNLLLQANRYGSDGYNLSNTAAQTQDPFHNYSFQLKSVYTFFPKTKWLFNARYFTESQKIKPYNTTDEDGNIEHTIGDATIYDVNINNTFEHRFSDKIKSNLRIYYTKYEAINHQYYTYKDPTQNSSYYDYFRQQFLRIENQTDIALNKKMDVTVGGGWILDNVKSNRYNDNTSTHKNNIGYLFSQYEWRPTDTWNVIAGLRFDNNQTYQSHLSPKLAVQKKIGNKLHINASVGGGFKAPDFRQLYLNLTNSAAGYTILGSTELQNGFKRLQQQGQIKSILIDPSNIKSLNPETSTGINVGANYAFTKNIHVNINLFRNDINNLIVSNKIAQKTNNQFIYSYLNIRRAYTQGLEAAFNWQITRYIKVEAGYQLLYTVDKDELNKIKGGTVLGRDNGNVYHLSEKDYKGLFGRSQHIGNIKVYYENENGWFANIRNIYRSGWGVADLDKNLYLNRGDKFANAYMQTNISIGKIFNNGLTIQGGSDNIFNYKDVEYLPELPGRTGYITISYAFKHTHKNKP